MPVVNVGKEGSEEINLYYEDRGSGKPVVLIHGYPLSGRAWEKQVPVLLGAGYRVIIYDRRGFGQSSQPWSGYNYDTFAQDLNMLVTKLNLSNFSLVGHSMGGGEVARYMGKYGTKNMSKAVIISGVPPHLITTQDDPKGIPPDVFADLNKQELADRPAFLFKFCSDFYNIDVLRGKGASDQDVQSSWMIAVAASPKAAHDCIDTWGTDFREDLKRVDIPLLVIQGDADRIVPIQYSGKRIQDYVKGSKLVVIPGGPHGIAWTHSDIVNRELLNFLSQEKMETARVVAQ
jgi:non-heme chloroperoxidase